jgi:Icc-related predicted phosphoesterase
MPALRVAAVGDVHLDEAMRGAYRPHLGALASQADVLLLAGDLTRHGTAGEAEVVAGEFAGVGVPVVAILGNHDLHADEAGPIAAVLRRAEITVLECTGTVLTLHGTRLGIAGTIGFGGGFPPGTIADFGEPEMKAFAARGRRLAAGLGEALAALECDVKVAMTHYAPIAGTLDGEAREIYPFLGNHLLADAIDRCGVALAVHGHAHAGSPDGVTPGGVPVHNVARPVLRAPYRVFTVATAGDPRKAVAR